MKKWLINPFYYVAGYKALIIGLLIMAISSVLCYLSGTHFDGVIYVHGVSRGPYIVFVFEALINLISIVLFLYLSALILSKSSFRFADIIGTQALARTPYLFVALTSLLPSDPIAITKLIQYKLAGIGQPVLVEPMYMFSFIMMSIISLMMLIWLIALMYQAYTISTNLKGHKAVLSFVISLILAEILSKTVLHFIYKELV